MAASDLPTVAELRADRPYLTPIITLGDGPPDERPVLYALQPKQMEAYRLTPLMRAQGPTHIGFGGAAGGGKSWLVRTVAVAVALLWPGSRVLILRETEGDVKRNHYEPLELQLNGRIQAKWNSTSLTVTFPNRSVIECGYLRHEKDFQRYLGNEYQCIIPEEATLLPPGLVVRLATRLRGGPTGARPFMLYPSNPGGQGHARYKRVFITRRYRDDEQGGDYAFVQSLLADNLELKRTNPEYENRFAVLPEPIRSWQRDGNWHAGAGSALEIDFRQHLIRPFPIPGYWEQFGAFDWGFQHPFSFGHYAVNEDGVIFKVETVWGVRLKPPFQAERIKAKVPVDQLRYIVAGHDSWAERRAEGQDTPSIQEQFAALGIYLTKANTDRRQGLQEFRKRLDWTTTGPWVDGKPTPGDPRLVFFDTDGNRRCLEQLETMVPDPADPEVALKVDANEFGEGGDDHYDETRYAVVSRPLSAKAPWPEKRINVFAPEVLAYEADESRRDRAPKPNRRQVLPEGF
jgi:phage terminase large subunit